MIGLLNALSLPGLIGSIIDLAAAWQKGRIGEAEMRAEVEKALIDAATAAYEEGQKTVRAGLDSGDPFVRRMWAVSFASSLFVQMWFLFIQPLGHALAPGGFPILATPDTLLEWNYAYLGAHLGILPMLPGRGGDGLLQRLRRWFVY